MPTFFKGFFLSLSLIVAIGAQNAFVIKQGISQNHIFAVSGICFLCDIVLMNLGIFGVGEFLAKNRILNLCITIIGILFVLCYGFSSLKAALFAQSSFEMQQPNKLSLKKTIFLTFAVTLLNPHVYLDTIFIVGASALMLHFDEKIIFACGALVASFLWFFGVGYGALKLSHILCRMTRIVDGFIALIMFFVAYSFIRFLIYN